MKGRDLETVRYIGVWISDNGQERGNSTPRPTSDLRKGSHSKVGKTTE